MKRVILLALTFLGLASLSNSCAPTYSTETVSVEVKYPPVSGVELSGRSMGVVYTHTDIPEDSLFAANLAEGFVSELESLYFAGETVLDIYNLHKNPDGNYGQLDTLVRLVMDTNCDVVFLIDCERGEDISGGDGDSYPLTMGLYVYDSLDPNDGGVKFFKGSVNSVNDGMGGELGHKAASKFRANWKKESFSLYYFYDENWWQAYLDASDMKWKEALKQWIKLADTNNLEKRACAEYNCAVACYMLGDLDLAEKWLDSSDKDGVLSLSAGLHKRIDNRRGVN